MDKIKVFENPFLSMQRNNELNEYRKTGKFTDLTLISTDSKTMRVHKNILSSSCPYFKAMLNGDLARQDKIQLVDNVTLADLVILVEYFYTGRAEVSLENVQNIFVKAQYLLLVELEKFCTEVLIENIKMDNSLEYWRNSVKYINPMLTVECLQFIQSNCRSFLERNILCLTAEELKKIMSAKEILEINQEDLYKFIMKWIRADSKVRISNLMELFAKLDFMKMSDEFITNEIMPDEILQTNPVFLSKIVGIMFKKLSNVKQQINTPTSSPRVPNYPNTSVHQVANYSQSQEFICSNSLKSIYLITNGGIYNLNLTESKWTKPITLGAVKTGKAGFATAGYKGDIYISGGMYADSTKIPTNFESWNMSTSKIYPMPPMIEGRSHHKLVNFKDKFYSCGGIGNNGSIEIFDCGKWIKGPNMNESKYSFGLITSDDSIYAFGGLNKNSRSNIVDQFDPREGKWRVISCNAPEISHAALRNNNNYLIHCFDQKFAEKLFDLRTNRWTQCLRTFFDDHGQYVWNSSYDIVNYQNDIFGILPTYTNWNTLKYNRQNKKWININIPLNLIPCEEVALCVNYEP